MDFNNPEIATMLLSFGKHVVLFDKYLESEIRKHKWSIANNGYVRCADATCGYTFMHQFVLGFSGNGHSSPDHINRVKTDNRNCNLRIISQSENCKNRVIRKDTLRGNCLTEREIQFLLFCHDYMNNVGVFPTYREIMSGMDFSSPHSVTQNLKTLVKKGLLKRHALKKYVFTEISKEYLQ